MTRPRLIIFTDLDGTLLDHDTYDWTPARPALEKLRQSQVPVVLNSSKTAAELNALRSEMGNTDPYIVENGAAAVIPAGYFAHKGGDGVDEGEDETVSFAAPRSEILAVLAELRAQGYVFDGFEDMTAEQLAEYADLTPSVAALAKQRLATEPLVWRGNGIDMSGFRQALEERGLRLVKGGRFQHVMGPYDKAQAMRYLTRRYQEFYGEPVTSVALGDSPNDRQMLEAADIGVVIRAAAPERLMLSDQDNVMYSDRKGPQGWNECVLTILAGKGY
ncbi:HAD-IIB family hydrolase [Marinobacter salicampi]|uniref:HAD-IIB family hydrolase n=1 Tax=Marinobacter salicampi TaxID=435907 RepID=UPI00140A2733|nr:HAD-IIB family hydrolase [Marinobacter salicampi]